MERDAMAERLGEYFDLQLHFAWRLSERSGMPLRNTVLGFTNLHRRFGLGDPAQGIAPAWEDFIGPLERLGDAAQRKAWTQDFYRRCAAEALPADQQHFGCFACEAPDALGVLRLHFVNRDGDDGVGPLNRAKAARRRGELAQLFAFVREHYPQAVAVRGVSWLYHLEAYRRLFPPAYGASARQAQRVRLSGSSSWGQFLRHDGAIKAELRNVLLQRLDTLELAAPWRAFPLPALVAAAPVELFFEALP
ncbi:MAG: hypothetical protein IV097_10150 [Burkholderiaceae bacterium]|nr:hypothetical protein [Burkholderiaceae bacterium]